MTTKPRISKEFEYAEWHYTCACSVCFTTVQLGCNDFKYKEKNSKVSFRYRCPVCGRPVVVDTDYIPKPVQERSKTIEDARLVALASMSLSKGQPVAEDNYMYSREWHAARCKKTTEANRLRRSLAAKPVEVIDGEAG